MKLARILGVVSAMVLLSVLTAFGGRIVESVSVSVPNTCSNNKTLTVKVTIRVKARTHVTVTLWEKDLGRDDKIDSQTVDPPPMDNPLDSANWEKTVTFQFKPDKFEVGKNLELCATAGDAKSAVVRIRCK